MITPRAATALRHRLVEVASSHGGLTSVVIGVLTWTWAKLAPVRAHVATWVDATVERLPDGVPWLPVVVGVAALTAATAATGLRRTRRVAPAPARTDDVR